MDGRVTMPNHGHAIINIGHDHRGAVEDAACCWRRAAPNTAARPGGEKGEETSPLQHTGGETTGGAPPPLRPTLGQIVAYYKYQTTQRINALRGTPGIPFWQRNYWEHVIRDEVDLNRIRHYIENNPLRWHEDQLNPIVPPHPTKR